MNESVKITCAFSNLFIFRLEKVRLCAYWAWFNLLRGNCGWNQVGIGLGSRLQVLWPGGCMCLCWNTGRRLSLNSRTTVSCSFGSYRHELRGLKAGFFSLGCWQALGSHLCTLQVFLPFLSVEHSLYLYFLKTVVTLVGAHSAPVWHHHDYVCYHPASK